LTAAPPAPPAELLLGRPEFAGDLADAARVVHGHRVLLTGAGGSIGWPLSQVLLRAEPHRLVLLDHHEHSLFSLERALGSADVASYELADIRDTSRVRGIFEQHQPEVVIHLAAAKHVPYGERFPEGAVGSNVLATRALLELADEAGTEVFVYPSSDKSVRPPSVYGASKRLAEVLVQDAAHGRRWAVVRFVNIIGTRGSVIETFTQQVLADRPLSVTDDRMTRYWISMREAMWCALSAAERASAGQIVMPDCGEAVPVLETARRLAGWYRPDRVPYPIACTGIRPGERLHEVLLSANESFGDRPVAAGVRAVSTAREASAVQRIGGVVEELAKLVHAGDRQALARACLEAAETLQ
jgi:FlaA1/EpsC-like NDP-sugar epimerase